MDPKLRDIVSGVKNPYRYIGGEIGVVSRPWDDCDVRVCLAFPDVYEIGMSHIGLSILYNILNGMDRVYADRVYAPWYDMADKLRKTGQPLYGLDSKRSLKDFDIVGFSLCYELTYTNVLMMLDLAGIPLYAKDRGDAFPLVIAGGPCTFNPMPVSKFFDAIVIGDGEDVICDIVKLTREGKEKNIPKKALLDNLSKLKGVFVPSSGVYNVGRAFVTDLESAKYPTRPIVPHKATQERMAVEVARGCTRGCRFCQAGYIYRPLRQRSGKNAVRLACEGIQNTGAAEYSFLSLSIGDWAPLTTALRSVGQSCMIPANATLPSLRAESLNQEMMLELGNARSGSFTLAPEAATERMRKIINKGNTDDDLYRSVQNVFELGWHAIKLYFMIGLPRETDAEIDGIVQISNKCLDIGRKYHKKPEVTVSTSIFIPKAHTPFQWEPQIPVARALEIQRSLKNTLRRPGLFYRWHDAGMSWLEGVFSRGGAELSLAIERAYKKGASFDAWDEFFKIDLWREVFSELDIDCDEYLRPRAHGFVFPWDGLGLGPDKDWLLREYQKAIDLLGTKDCARDKCSGCGICDFDYVKNRLAVVDLQSEFPAKEKLAQGATLTEFKNYRLKYQKTGTAIFFGQIETLDIIRRAFRASLLPVAYTQGYHPRPKISSGPALPASIESLCEFVDVEFIGGIDDEALLRLNKYLPFGLKFVEKSLLVAGTGSIDDCIAESVYEIGHDLDTQKVEGVVLAFHRGANTKMLRRRKDREEWVDIKDYLDSLAVNDGCVLGLAVNNKKPQLKVSEILLHLFGEVKWTLIKKVDAKFAR